MGLYKNYFCCQYMVNNIVLSQGFLVRDMGTFCTITTSKAIVAVQLSLFAAFRTPFSKERSGYFDASKHRIFE